MRPLSALAHYINGYAFKPDHWGKDGLPIIRIEQLRNPSATTDYFSGRLPDANIIEDGDLVFSWSASLFLRIWNHGRAALNQHLFKVVEAEGVNRLFLKLLIEYCLPGLVNASHGSTMQHITRKELDRFKSLLPSDAAEQSKIAEVLSTVDRAIAQTEALIAKQQRIKTGLMQDLLTRGIDEHGQLRSEATHAFKDSPLGRIPVEWECDSIVNSMGQIMDFRGRTPKKLGLDWGGEIPALSAMNVEMGKLNFQKHTNFGDDNLYCRWMTHGDAKEGDVIMTTEAPLGNVAQIPNSERYILSQRVILLRGKVGAIDNTFMRHYLSSQLFRKTMHEQSSGTTATGIQRRKLEQLLIRVPPIDEQANIAAAIDGCDGEVEAAISQREKFSCLKTALMQDLLTGKVRVTPLLQPAKEATA